MDAQLLVESALTAWNQLPDPLAAVLWLLGAWLAASLARLIVAGVLQMLRFDRMCERTGATAFLRTGMVNYMPSRLMGAIIYWALLLAGILLAARRVDARLTQALADRLADALPGLLAAGAILVVGLLLVAFVFKFVRTLARNAASPYAELLAQGTRVIGSMLVVAAAVEQLDVGRAIIHAIFIILLASIGLGLALAFGLGCRDMAHDAMERFLHEIKERSRTNSRGDLEG